MLPEYPRARRGLRTLSPAAIPRRRLEPGPRREQWPHCLLPIDGRSAHSPTERRITYKVISAAPLAPAEP